MKRSIAVLLLLVSSRAAAETRYKLPPREVVALFDAAQPPQPVLSPRGDLVLLVTAEAYPPIALLAQPLLRVAGVRISPQLQALQHTTRQAGLQLQKTEGGAPLPVALPKDARISLPVWSPDGRRFAFTRDLEDGVELWTGDAATGAVKPLAGLRVSDVLGPAFTWTKDSTWLLVRAVPKGREPAPSRPQVPLGPTVDETRGKTAAAATYQDLLKDEHDQDLFEYYAKSHLALVDSAGGAVRPLGEPGLYSGAVQSPDGRYLLVTKLRRPFSYRVPYASFTRTIEVWDAQGQRVTTIADLGVSDEVPRQGVPVGPRAVVWQPLQTATLVWTEALDGGDPMKPVPHRERLMTLAAPFDARPREILKLKHRFTSLEWTAQRNQALLTEFERSRRWLITHLVDLQRPETDRVVFDRSRNDDYADPGAPVVETRPNGEELLLQDGDTIYLSGNGASPEGDRPFLDALDLKTLKKQRLFLSKEQAYQRFLGFAKGSRSLAVVRSESVQDPPNLFLTDIKSGERKPLTTYQDPSPELRKLKKQLVKYQRADGVALSGTLYLPADYKPGTRLPAFVWAYPLEYSDSDTAGQVRGSPHMFTRLLGPSPLFFATQGYAVLMDATMPIVGDPETVNNSYVEQLRENARAAVAKLEALGVVDPRRVVVGGHSYGAFMTANLLAHTDLFVAGIARSGAYNRTLTPFGFQTERRSFWEAGDTYMKMSPFAHANTINEPLLLIHGEADNNSGTFPIQSERLYAALQGNGGTARLVMLPHESHGYRGRESVLHTLAEMLEWADRWAKNGH